MTGQPNNDKPIVVGSAVLVTWVTLMLLLLVVWAIISELLWGAWHLVDYLPV